MSDPVIADKKPAVLTLQPGTYMICTCGRSENQPYCDGKHGGTGFKPIRLVVEEEKRMALCQCKHSGKMPECDGSHSGL